MRKRKGGKKLWIYRLWNYKLRAWFNISNSGKCQENSRTQICNCEPGYKGEDCSEPDCSILKCKNGIFFIISGKCVNEDGKIKCACAKGWRGIRCDTVDCTNIDCNHGKNTLFLGTCADMNGVQICLCHDGWTGKKCNIVHCDSYGCENSISFFIFYMENALSNMDAQNVFVQKNGREKNVTAKVARD